MQYSAEFIILAPPFDSNFKITWQKITSWEKWILRIKPRWLPFILDSPTSAPRGQRLLLQPVQKTGTKAVAVSQSEGCSLARKSPC